MRILVGCALALATTAANAECVGWSPNVVQISGWSAEPADKPDTGVYHLSVELKNVAGRSFRMVEGRVYFEDSLGRHIALMKLNPDLSLDVEETGAQTWRRIVGQRSLASINRDDVLSWACVQSVVYDDGTKEVFDQ